MAKAKKGKSDQKRPQKGALDEKETDAVAGGLSWTATKGGGTKITIP